MDNKITQEEMVRAMVSESKGGYYFPIEATSMCYTICVGVINQ